MAVVRWLGVLWVLSVFPLAGVMSGLTLLFLEFASKNLRKTHQKCH